MFDSYWPFIAMYVAGGVSIFAGICRHDMVECCLSVAYVLAAIGWQVERKKKEKALFIANGVMKNNDELMQINKELSTKNHEHTNLIGGLISENKELKLKLKNAKMEASRLRGKGGKKDE